MFVGAPFGYKHVPVIFHYVMEKIFRDMSFALVYLDDIIVISNSFEEHLSHCRAVVKRLNKYNLQLQAVKCIVGKTDIVILGKRVSQAGISDVPEKILIMNSWKPPSTG
jgi:hypothetical protein